MYIRNFERVETTVVSNRFIDGSMMRANGEYVKVYLYLLRLAQDPGEEIQVTDLADRLDDTEKDVMRALRYWEKEGWLRLEYEIGSEVVSGVGLTDPESREHVSDRETANAAGQVSGAAGQMNGASGQPSGAAGQPDEISGGTDGQGKTARPEVKALTPEIMEQLEKDEEFRQFTFVAETYLGRTLTPKDVQLFAYLYDVLKFPEDLMEYLVEYCVGGGHRSSRYMETVALNWHQEGKVTVQLAKESQRAYSRENKLVMKAFGISGRVLNEEERGYIEKWTREYRLPLDVIEEGCNTTIAAIQKPSFQYADTILTDWYQAGIHTVEEARQRKEKRKSSRPAENDRKQAGEKKNGAETRFGNYQQRNIDYDALLNQSGLNPYGKE